MVTVAEYFELGKRQSELDFVNVPIDADLPLFLDPFAISLRSDPWSHTATLSIQSYFQLVLDRIRAGRSQEARTLLSRLTEPNETRLGFSSGRPRGSGIGAGQAEALYQAIADSAAVKSGFISHLEEAELMIAGIGRDRISDLTTNVLRKQLTQYTLAQCTLLGIPTSTVTLGPYFDTSGERWISSYFELPVANDRPVLFVPKAIVRYDLAYDHQRYYRHFVLDFLRSEELSAGSSLVSVLRNGRLVVYKKDLEEKYPNSKEFLYEFSKAHPGVLEDYRTQLTQSDASLDTPVADDDEPQIATLLARALRNTPKGPAHASSYHSLMVGILEFVFFPQMLHPVKEREIHSGRKRIDIVMENGARPGQALYSLHAVKALPCPYVHIECKNYTREVANPELDQLSGRLSVNRGKLGILCCREFEDRDRFVSRCRDTFTDDRGLLIPLDDEAVLELLALVESRKRSAIDNAIRERIAEVWL